MVRVGATVYRVVKEVDRAEPVVVREVEIRKGWPLAAYEERLHRTGWEIIIEATRNLKVFEIFFDQCDLSDSTRGEPKIRIV